MFEFSGTGVGLVKTSLPTGEIVREVRDGARETIRKLAEEL
jgi:hypothetical protein